VYNRQSEVDALACGFAEMDPLEDANKRGPEVDEDVAVDAADDGWCRDTRRVRRLLILGVRSLRCRQTTAGGSSPLRTSRLGQCVDA